MNNLEKAFSRMKAKVQIKQGPRAPIRGRRGRVIARSRDENYSVNVRDGKFIFDLGATGGKVTIQDSDTKDRHILINVQREVEDRKEVKPGVFEVTRKRTVNDKWLCGHDERDWFVAAAQGINIWEAKQNLKPNEVKARELGVKMKNRQKRKNEAFRRQGEWFFVKADEKLIPQNPIIHYDEPMSRPGGGKPHIVQEVFRLGGTTVWSKGDRVVTDKEYQYMNSAEKYGFMQRQANATVFCRGYVKHPDHDTIILDTWHHIFMNGEKRDRSGATMMFLD
jgi:hypothetical protein